MQGLDGTPAVAAAGGDAWQALWECVSPCVWVIV